jgi:hypothetical protein
MTIDDLLKMNGPRNGSGRVAVEHPPGENVPDDFWAHRWDNLRLAAMTLGRDSQTVVELMVRSPEYRTAQAVGVGSSRETVQRAYGLPTTVAVALPGWWCGIYDQVGMTVQISPTDGVRYISVFRPGTAKQLYRLPGGVGPGPQPAQ